MTDNLLAKRIGHPIDLDNDVGRDLACVASEINYTLCGNGRDAPHVLLFKVSKKYLSVLHGNSREIPGTVVEVLTCCSKQQNVVKLYAIVLHSNGDLFPIEVLPLAWKATVSKHMMESYSAVDETTVLVPFNRKVHRLE